MEKLAPVPEIGEEYWFYANDQVKKETEFRARIMNVIPFEKGDSKIIYKYDEWTEEVVNIPLIDLWTEELLDSFWILSEKTDYFIELDVPELCHYHVYVARDVDGNWHSFETMLSKQFGFLDIYGDNYRKLHELNKN
jgi:hypothetical protein